MNSNSHLEEIKDIFKNSEYRCITMNKPKKVSSMTQKILSDAQQYEFYYIHIMLLTMMVMIGIENEPYEAMKYFYAFNKKGWSIIYRESSFVEIKYIFVYPQYRHQGFFTQLLTLLKSFKKEICVCTRDIIMLKALVSNEFKLKGNSLCKKELKYILPYN